MRNLIAGRGCAERERDEVRRLLKRIEERDRVCRGGRKFGGGGGGGGDAGARERYRLDRRGRGGGGFYAERLDPRADCLVAAQRRTGDVPNEDRDIDGIAGCGGSSDCHRILRDRRRGDDE